MYHEVEIEVMLNKNLFCQWVGLKADALYGCHEVVAQLLLIYTRIMYGSKALIN